MIENNLPNAKGVVELLDIISWYSFEVSEVNEDSPERDAVDEQFLEKLYELKEAGSTITDVLVLRYGPSLGQNASMAYSNIRCLLREMSGST